MISKGWLQNASTRQADIWLGKGFSDLKIQWYLYFIFLQNVFPCVVRRRFYKAITRQLSAQQTVSVTSVGSRQRCRHALKHTAFFLQCTHVQPGIFTGRTNAETEASMLWSPDVKNWLIGKDSDAWKDWRQKEKEVTEDEMVGWHYWLSGHEFEQTPKIVEDRGARHAAVHGVANSQTRLSNWTELNIYIYTTNHFPVPETNTHCKSTLLQ